MLSGYTNADSLQTYYEPQPSSLPQQEGLPAKEVVHAVESVHPFSQLAGVQPTTDFLTQHLLGCLPVRHLHSKGGSTQWPKLPNIHTHFNSSTTFYASNNFTWDLMGRGDQKKEFAVVLGDCSSKP